MVILWDFPYNNAWFRLVVHHDPCCFCVANALWRVATVAGSDRIPLFWYLSSDQFTLVIRTLYIGDGLKLPSYIGIILSHYKDPYQPSQYHGMSTGFGFFRSRCSPCAGTFFWKHLLLSTRGPGPNLKSSEPSSKHCLQGGPPSSYKSGYNSYK